MITITDLDGTITYVNQSNIKRLGYPAEHIQGQSTSVYGENATHGATQQEILEETLRHKYWRGEVVNYTRTGDPLILDCRTQMVVDDWGKPLALCGISTDITDRKQMEQALRASEARYRTIFETANIAIWEEDFSDVKALIDTLPAQGVTDIAGYLDAHPEFVTQAAQRIKVLDVNQTTLRMFHADTKAELVGNIGKIFIPETNAILKQELLALARGDTYFKGETVNATLTGERLNVILTMTLPQEPHALEHVLISLIDITARKQIEQEREALLAEIRTQARQMQQIIDTVPEGVFLLNSMYQIILANPVAKKMLAELTTNGPNDKVTHLGTRPLEELLTSPPTRGLWHEITHRHHTYEVIARPMENHAQAGNWVMVLRDVTQYRATQYRVQQQERLAAVGQLAAGIAHDFNNIMAIIVLYAQMSLQLSPNSAQLTERLHIIEQQAKRATALIQQILDFSRRAVLERQPTPLYSFLNEQIKLLERTIPENIRIAFTYGQAPYIINADPTRIQQAIMNLAVNARDAMPHGGRMTFGLEHLHLEDSHDLPLPEMKCGHWIHLTVTDTGTGIPDDVLPHIFDPFFTTKEPKSGTGLGLAQVHGIVKLHAGEINVETQLGVGTTFHLYFPALPETTQPITVHHHEELPYGHGETILIVEDDPNIRVVLAETINTFNYRTLTAATGREALAVLAAHPHEIDLIVSDFVMPDMGGQALFTTLQKQNCTIPMIIVSGHPLDNELDIMQAQGLAGWLAKPPELEPLAQLLAQALRAPA